MNFNYLGDSYDHVKRTLIACADGKPWAAAILLPPPMEVDSTEAEKVHCYEKFLGVIAVDKFRESPAEEDRKDYFEKLKKLADDSEYNLLLDPCTGIRHWPFGRNARKYVTTQEIAQLTSSRLLACYDQSLSRGSEDNERLRKLKLLQGEKVFAFYFRSHASILWASRDEAALESWRRQIECCGIPKARLQSIN